MGLLLLVVLAIVALVVVKATGVAKTLPGVSVPLCLPAVQLSLSHAHWHFLCFQAGPLKMWIDFPYKLQYLRSNLVPLVVPKCLLGCLPLVVDTSCWASKAQLAFL